MNVNDFFLCLGLSGLVLAPAIWIWFGLHRIEQYIQRIESRLDKYKSNQKDGE